MQHFNLLSLKNKLEDQEPSESKRGYGKESKLGVLLV